jgi:putative hydrolase of the HAD superfamily
MRESAIDLIALDADDTLWHNERSYRAARARFGRLLAVSGVTLSAAEIDAHINETELMNLRYFGYGVSSFALSLIESAIALTDGRIAGADLMEIIDLAKEMIGEKVEVFANVRQILTELAASYPLMLITKGDLLHQTAKLDRSGLRDCFRFVEVVSQKTREVYAEILSRQGMDPSRFLMAGNSLRSDVVPVLELGGWAVHVPAEPTWSHEHADVTAELGHRYLQVATLDQLPAAIRQLTSERPAKPDGSG